MKGWTIELKCWRKKFYLTISYLRKKNIMQIGLERGRWECKRTILSTNRQLSMANRNSLERIGNKKLTVCGGLLRGKKICQFMSRWMLLGVHETINHRRPRPGCVISRFFESLGFDLVSRKLIPLREDEHEAGNRKEERMLEVRLLVSFLRSMPFLSFVSRSRSSKKKSL